MLSSFAAIIKADFRKKIKIKNSTDNGIKNCYIKSI